MIGRGKSNQHSLPDACRPLPSSSETKQFSLHQEHLALPAATNTTLPAKPRLKKQEVSGESLTALSDRVITPKLSALICQQSQFRIYIKQRRRRPLYWWQRQAPVLTGTWRSPWHTHSRTPHTCPEPHQPHSCPPAECLPAQLPAGPPLRPAATSNKVSTTHGQLWALAQ